MTASILAGLKPEIVWSIFEEISKVPRPSKKEEKIRAWVRKWAKEHKVSIKEDKTGNILLKVGASSGCKKYPSLLLQAHMDMVCQKQPDVDIDFENDPIPIKVTGPNVTAKGTTLGADNGIGMAYCLAALIDKDLKHGPLEVLLTVDEETGLTGAFAVKKGFFKSKFLLNVDSEALGTITISSAGGGGTDFVVPIKRKSLENHRGIQLTVSGLQGGHSGVDIDLPRLNAIKVGTDAINSLGEGVLLSSIEGGSAHNAIPRDFSCEIVVPKAERREVLSKLSHWKKETLAIARETEPDLKINFRKTNTAEAISAEESKAIIDLLVDIEHGPHTFSKEITGLVQTSSNLAVVSTQKKEVQIHVSTRSSVNEELDKTRQKLKSLGESLGAKVTLDKAYPGWKPQPEAPFTQMAKKAYEGVIDSPVELQAIHAGLECGLFVALDPELQVASIGPKIDGAHSPDESVEIASVEVIWNVVRAIIEGMESLA